MSLQKRKCQKGFEHSGRSIQAVCLQPNCQNDRLLCFYCIHESHSSHSIAYLIPGLKSPLQMLNKNSQITNPQKHMKYIEKRFNRINNAWLKISDNLQNGISRIQERMMPQFNVIRQTFKKNSVQKIIKELTSNQVTESKIQQYVDMINMVKKYKFNDIKKLKFMTFIIEHKLSKIFLNANNKIKQIMNNAIQQTDQMNFLNFNLEDLMKDRDLFLQISKHLNFYKIDQLDISSDTLPNSEQIEASQDGQQNCILVQDKSHHPDLDQDQIYGEESQRICQEKTFIQNQQQKVGQSEQNPNKIQQAAEQNDQDLSSDHSNGFRSYRNAFFERQDTDNQNQEQKEITENKSQKGEQIQHEYFKKVTQEKIQLNQKSAQNQGYKSMQLQQGQIVENSQIDQLQQPHSNQPQRESNSDIQNIKIRQQQQQQPMKVQEQPHNEEQVIHQDNSDQQDQRQSDIQPQSNHSNDNRGGQSCQNQKLQKDQCQVYQLSSLHADEIQINWLEGRESRKIQEFSCQFQVWQHKPDDLNNQTQDQIRPSYQFSLTVTSNQMTLSNSFDLKINRDFVRTQPELKRSHKIQLFDEDNQFQDIFGLRDQQKDENKTRRFQMLKKYYIFSKQQNQDQSSQQTIKAPQKRVKWVQDHKEQRETSNQCYRYVRKKIKKNEGMAPSTIVQEFDLTNHPRTRSQRLKMSKIEQQSMNPDTDFPVINKKPCKQNQPVDNFQQNYHGQQNPYPTPNQPHTIQEQQPQHSRFHHTKLPQINGISNLEQQQYLNNAQQDQEYYNQQIYEKQNIQLIQNHRYDSQINQQQQNVTHKNRMLIQLEQVSHSQEQKNFLKHRVGGSVTNKVSSSVKLDNQGLAYVSSSLLAKHEKAYPCQRQGQAGQSQKKVKATTVYLSGKFHQQIKKTLSLIDQQFVEHLTIYCDTMDCAVNQDSVEIICKMTKLTKLCIYWAYKLNKVLTKKLIYSLPRLEELVLCQFQDLDTEIASQIVHRLPCLRRFHYASDYMRNLDKMEENLQFLIDFVGNTTNLAPLYTLSKLKNLETFWISDIQDLKQARQIIMKMKNLKQVSISAFQKKNKDLNSIFSVLSKKTTLISLSLQSLQFKQDNLVAIIHRNPNLNTLVINQCPTVSNDTISAVANTCHNLEQLFLMLTDSLEGERIFQLKKLKTLVVRACWSINASKFRQGLKKLQNLKYLSLNMNNYWLGDEMLLSISMLPNLTFLNLDTTKVTDKGMQNLVNLKNLKTLICGRTQITASGLYKFLEKTKSKIQKLGLSRESNQELNRPQKINKHDVIYTQFQGKYLVKIGQLLPKLTHLSIGGFKNLYIENFATLDHLECLQYKLQSLPEETQKFLQATKLNLNANF